MNKPSLRLEGPGGIPALARADDNSDDVTGWRDVDAPLDEADDLDDWIRSSFAATSSAWATNYRFQSTSTYYW